MLDWRHSFLILKHEFLDLQVHSWLSNAVGNAGMSHLEHATSKKEYVEQSMCHNFFFFLMLHQGNCAKE